VTDACATVLAVRRRRLRLVLLCAIALAAAGCGGSSAPNAASVPVATTTQTATTPSTASTTTTSTATTPPRTTTTATTTTPTTTTSTTPTTTTATTTTPAPTGPGGLSAATGYGSYDNCQGTCSGSVPTSLRRGLHLPSLGAGGACPVSAVAASAGYAGPAVGSGPVYAAQPSPLPITSFINSAWDGARVTWVASPSYTGPVLIRGGKVSSSGPIGFGEGHVPDDELQLLTASTKSSGEPPGAREWPSFTRMRSAGCYAYQVDGTNFSEVIVFQATG
jgi:hypothetical protein